jgi:hypothetical protein
MLRLRVLVSVVPLLVAAILARVEFLPSTRPCVVVGEHTLQIRLADSAEAADFAVVDDVDGAEDSACEVTPATRFVAVTATRSGPAPVIYLSIDGPADYRIFVRSKRFTAREAAALIVGAHGGYVRLADASL